jgi:ABC-type Fe3+-hydroxamate transport system substrate-binding protein
MPLIDALGREQQQFAGVPRIVSLVPSLTELICDLGLGDCLAGRTGFCVHPREMLRRVPKVGGTKDVKLDLVRRLAPTHVIADIDENRRDAVEAMMEFVPRVIVVHPRTVDDNLGLYALLGGVFRRDAEAARLAADFSRAREELATVAATLPREAVLYPIWREPWMTVRRDTYIAAMLAAAGWDTLPAEAPLRYPEFAWDAPWLAGVARVLLPSEPYAFTDQHLAEVGTLAQRPVTRIDGEMVSWYGSRAIAGLRYLAGLRRRLA